MKDLRDVKDLTIHNVQAIGDGKTALGAFLAPFPPGSVIVLVRVHQERSNLPGRGGTSDL